MQLEKGFIQVYTGNGKGKTTAALGLALRAAGREMKVCMIQFLKGGGQYGEHLAAAKLTPYLTIVQTGSSNWCRKGNPTTEDVHEARKALDLAKKSLTQGCYDLVILDEVNNAIHYNLVSVDEVLKLMELKPDRVELVLTGRYADERIIAAADLVTEMREIKHYYKAGVTARVGIEK
jgi:cob(I)alamin adenosyltransferase